MMDYTILIEPTPKGWLPIVTDPITGSNVANEHTTFWTYEEALLEVFRLINEIEGK